MREGMDIMGIRDGVLRGYVERDGDSYFAICLDLNIYARGESADEAVDLCQQLTQEYFDEAIGEDRVHFSDLVPRRAPFYFWARYFYLRLRGLFLFGRPGPDRPAQRAFKTPLATC